MTGEPAPRPAEGSAPALPSAGAELRYGAPWADPPGDRDPSRRARGRMPAPVTVWLAPGDEGPGTEAAGKGRLGVYRAGMGTIGLTVSSLVIAPGQPGRLAGIVSPTTDLGDLFASGSAKAFTVHILGQGHRELARHFAGDVPAQQAALRVEVGAAGPALAVVSDRIYCRDATCRAFGWSLLVEAEVQTVELGERRGALAWWSGAFVELGG